MKLLAGLTILMIVFVVFGIHTQQQILGLASDMQEMVPNISREINNENWDAARNDTARLLEQWNEIQDRWDLFIVHSEIEQVELYIARILSYLSSEDKAAALAELAALNTQLSHIYRKEMFNVQNIF